MRYLYHCVLRWFHLTLSISIFIDSNTDFDIVGTFRKGPFPKHTSHFEDIFVIIIIYIKVEICSKQNKRVFDNYHANSSPLLTGRLTFNVVQLAHNPQHQLELQLLL